MSVSVSVCVCESEFECECVYECECVCMYMCVSVLLGPVGLWFMSVPPVEQRADTPSVGVCVCVGGGVRTQSSECVYVWPDRCHSWSQISRPGLFSH